MNRPVGLCLVWYERRDSTVRPSGGGDLQQAEIERSIPGAAVALGLMPG